MPKLSEQAEAVKHDVNTRVFEVMDYIISNKVNGIADETKFLKSIGYNSTKNLALIKKSVQSFQLHHLQNLCEIYGVSGDFILNTNTFKMFAKFEKLTPLQKLIIVAKEAEIYMKK